MRCHTFRIFWYFSSPQQFGLHYWFKSATPSSSAFRVKLPSGVPTTALSMRNKLREQKAWNSLNQLISLCDEERRHFETKRFGGLEIDHQLELRRLLDG